MLSFQRLKTPHQLVKFKVRDFRIVEHVIPVLMMANLLAQLFKLLLNASGQIFPAKLEY